MEKIDFLRFVEHEISNNPEWFGETVSVMQRGLNERIKKEVEQRAKAEFALVMAYEMADKALLESNPANKASIHKVMKNSFVLEGTKFANEIDV